ncbi:MAG: glycosyl hydrolase family 18 protein [Bacteroidetes bacterium]|nr:glycosyl hydrolase family 18 protein [Bacteroidota bacterium]
MKTSLKTIALLKVCLLISTLCAGRTVMSWIPVYGNSACKTNLFNSSKKTWLKDGLTHIGLQFWVPGDSGKVVPMTNYQYKNQAGTLPTDIQNYVTWGNTNGVKIMLCIYNVRTNGFDWSLTQNVINNYPTQTIANLVAIVQSYGLDGVDVDFEGVGKYAADKAAYVSFIAALSLELHKIGKELSLDMFSTPCYNFPNPSWDSDLSAYVDFVNVMGYDKAYEKDVTLFAYCPETPSEANSYALRYSYMEHFATVNEGLPSAKLNFGIPGTKSTWGGDSLYTHLIDIASISSKGGIAIWDLRLTGQGLWLQEKTWELLAMFKNNSTADQMKAKVSNTLSTAEIVAKVNPVLYDSVNESITFSSSTGIAYLYDITGELQGQWQINEGQSISLSDKISGTYLLKFESDNDCFVLKLVTRT